MHILEEKIILIECALGEQFYFIILFLTDYNASKLLCWKFEIFPKYVEVPMK